MSILFSYGIDRLSLGMALALANNEEKGGFSEATRSKIAQSRTWVSEIVRSGKAVYGVNTGFGPLCTTIIDSNQTAELQMNLLKSHSVGVGEPIPLEVARLMLVLKIQSLAQAYSGISMEVLERLQWHLEKNIIPMVPVKGSVGASGDLAPLAHLFLPLIGEGKLWYKDEWKNSRDVLQKEGLLPLELKEKEGIALINGTQFIAAFAVHALNRLLNCLDTADIIAAMSVESVLGSASPFDEDLHKQRAFVGSNYVAYRVRKFLNQSEMVASHINCGRVQDPYSIRCIPQVHGASRNAWLHLKELTTTEINSVTDNPLIFSKDKVVSGGNFHGQLLALPLDYACIAACELGSISERRSYLLLEGQAGLPKLLMKEIGLHSGFMIPQYTAAALVSENKVLAHPASVDSIPTSLGQEDHVSMGSISARKLNEVISNLEHILSIELLYAAQAFDYRRPLKSSRILEDCHQYIRTKIDHIEKDKIFSEDMEVACGMIRRKEIVRVCSESAKENNIDLVGDWKGIFEL